MNENFLIFHFHINFTKLILVTYMTPLTFSNLFSNSKDYAVIRADAECFFTCFIVEHNLPLNCADHVGSLLRKMFPENEIAKKYSCARTKTSAIISEVAARSQKTLACTLKKQAFSLIFNEK